MDSLAQYGDDDDDSDNEVNNAPGLIGPLPPSRTIDTQRDAAPSSPPAQPRFVLPPPDFGDGPPVDHTRHDLGRNPTKIAQIHQIRDYHSSPSPDLNACPDIFLTRFSTQGSSGTKRGASAVSGSVLVQQGPQKSSKPPAQIKPRLPSAAPQLAPHLHAAMLPPQLRGRSNVGTEDLEKMFGKQHFKAKAKE